MAYLVKPVIVKWIDPKTGKRVEPGTRGAKKLKTPATKWYGCGIPGKGKRRVPLASEKTAAQRKLDQMVRAAERGETDLPDPNARNVKLTEGHRHDTRNADAEQQPARLGSGTV